MGNKRGGRSKRSQGSKQPIPTQVLASSPAQQSKPANRWRRLKGWIFSTKAIVLELIAFFGCFPAYEIYFKTTPELRINASDPKSPFMFPFMVKNPSNIFSMQVAPTCNLLKVVGLNIHWGKMELKSGSVDIGPNDEKPLQCVYTQMPMSVQEAEQTVQLNYSTRVFGWLLPRDPTTPVKYVWQGYASNPQWVPHGEIK